MNDPDESSRFKFDWQRKILACRLGASTTAAALALSTHTNKKGGNAHPGVRLLAHETEMGESTVRDCLRHLRDLGLVVRVLCGSQAEHRDWADVYDLAIPDDLADRIDTVEKPAKAVRAPNRGGKANHVRWHEKRDVVDPRCSYCAEVPGALARAREGSANPQQGVGGPSRKGAGKGAVPIRPPLGRTPITARTDSDHRSVEEHQQSFTNTTRNHHPAPPVAGPRASSQAESALPADLIELQEKITDALGELTTAEESEVREMLVEHVNPIAIIREIRKARGSAA